ncbi:MFS transporter [Actinomyces wuliandei]|uniref:MFS transporter n=1 Tax=Actinomyces wuliandei TaxID=2057743 RepID=UPI000FDC98A6|nr:MFS transporter [Actinomyces wuliandei]
MAGTSAGPGPRTPPPASAVSRLNTRVIGICVAAALGGFLFGFDTAVINGAVDALAGDFALGPALTGFSVSSTLIGCAAGAWFAGTAGGTAEVLWMGRPAWRWMFMAEAVPAVLYGLFAFRLPESPRFLVARGRYDKASQVLYDFTGVVNVNLKTEEIRSTIDSGRRESLTDLRGPCPGLKPVVWVGVLLLVGSVVMAVALAVAAAAQWAASLVVSTAFPVLSDIGLIFAYGLYAVCALLSFVFVLRSVPGTKAGSWRRWRAVVAEGASAGRCPPPSGLRAADNQVLPRHRMTLKEEL